MTPRPDLVDLLRHLAADAGLLVPDDGVSRAAGILPMLAEGAPRLGLSTISTPEEAALKHVVDSWLLTRVAEPPTSLVDVGCGCGFPGLGLALAWPEAHVHLVDSRRRSVLFAEQLAALCGLANVTTHHARAEQEETAASVGNVEIVVARAFSPRSGLADAVGHFVVSGALFVAYTGEEGVLGDLLGAIGRPGPVWQGRTRTVVPGANWTRWFDLVSPVERPPLIRGSTGLECFT